MRTFSVALLLTGISAASFAQNLAATDNLAPYIPTPQLIVEKMLESAHVRPGDVVYDLGSGDGRILFTAVQEFGAKAVGIEILPELCDKTRERVRSMGLDDKIRVIQASVLRVDLSPADVVTMYLLTGSNERLRPNLEKYLKPGSRVVSNQFPVKGWKPTEVVHVKDGSMEHTIYVYKR
jgi:16S rRNA A1518/A1519 N6-dimethyltransferase RsmA/KsgA/DIM1 with predicted DNA glycosylase/AP lyase activity